MRNLRFFLILAIVAVIIFRRAFFNFFAQDDFIFIKYFSGGSLGADFASVFAWPSVTHFRPLYNFYFFVNGNVFGLHPFGYHLVTLLIHVVASFFIYKSVNFLTKSQFAGIASAIFYELSCSHFVSLYWIAGVATPLGFLFLISAFYGFLKGKKFLAIVLFVLSLLASEAMASGIILFISYAFLYRKPYIKKFLVVICAVTIIFLVLRTIFFTSAATFETYTLSIGPATIGAIKYYLLRISGFAEGSSYRITTFMLLMLLGFLCVIFYKKEIIFREKKIVVFALSIMAAGLFPFVLIPFHLSGHYMNISIFGFALLIGTVLKSYPKKFGIMIIFVYSSIQFLNVQFLENNSWAVARAKLAKTYLSEIDKRKLASGSVIVFRNNRLSDSKEAYVTLGEGKAVDLMFPGKSYKSCFTFMDSCDEVNSYVPFN